VSVRLTTDVRALIETHGVKRMLEEALSQVVEFHDHPDELKLIENLCRTIYDIESREA
jgi:hypothetical protein